VYSSGFDTRLVQLRHGRIDGPSVPEAPSVSASIAAKYPETAMWSRFPGIGPAPWRTADGRAGVDILELIQSPFQPDGPSILVYRRLDLTAVSSR